MSRLIVKNLPKTITEDKIRKIFSQKGDITDIQLKFTPDGKFRQFCFIGYRTDEQAKDAIEFFNNTCISTSKINVQECAQLGDTAKPKAWSKYSSDSSAYKKIHKDPIEENVKEVEEETPKEHKHNKIRDLVEKYKDDPMFEEFMQIHGTKNINTLLEKLEESEKNIEQQEQNEDDNSDSGNESTQESEEKVANKKISDLEYMQLLIRNSIPKKSEPRKRTEKKPKEIIKLFTVKLRGLPYACKKADLKQFFSPLVPYTIRIPRNTKGFAYVGFKTEKKMKQALNKDKSFISGKRIAVFEYVQKDDQQNNHEQPDNNDFKKTKWNTQEDSLKHEEDIAESGRIFIRNLAYTTTENDIQEVFEKFGPITEVNLPIDKITRKLKGFGVVTFLMPEHAVKAYSELDGSILQGRMLHLLPAKAKDLPEGLKNTDGLNYKQKKALKDKAQAGSSHNWNSLFMGHDAVADVIADSYNTSKEQVLDGRGKGSAAVRLALGETQIIAQTKQFLEDSGVLLHAFNQPCSQRSKTVILVKNLPAQTHADEIQKLFAPHGLIGRVILPPSGITALVEFLEPSEARKAFTKLAYTKFKNAPLYLEWAPDNSLKASTKIAQNKLSDNKTISNNKSNEKIVENTTSKIDESKTDSSKDKEKVEEEEVEEEEVEKEEPETDTTLFVKNLNFTTTEESLQKHFERFGKLNYVSIATKKDPQNPGRILSMGYGFVRYYYKAGANKALKELQQSTLDGKTLELKRSERTFQSEVKTEKKETKVTKQNGTKILVRNIPFQANKNEVEELFKAFGEIKDIRLPKKLTLSGGQHRGFAFVDYVTKSDAKRAFEALSQSTHLYGRRLVLEWAASEEGVDEIRKRTAKHFHSADGVRNKKGKAAIDAETFVNNS